MGLQCVFMAIYSWLSDFSCTIFPLSENYLNDTKIIEFLTLGGDAQTLTVGSPYVEVSKGPYSYRLIVPEKHKSTTNVFVTLALHGWKYAEHETDKFTCKCQANLSPTSCWNKHMHSKTRYPLLQRIHCLLPLFNVHLLTTSLGTLRVQRLERRKETMSVRERVMLGKFLEGNEQHVFYETLRWCKDNW